MRATQQDNQHTVSAAVGGDQNRFQLLVEAVLDYAIYMLDPSGKVVSWNSGAERFKGYKAQEIIGQHFSCFYTEEDRAAGIPQHALRTSALSGKFETEGWRVRKDGSQFWAHVVIDPIRDSQGELLGFAKVTRDLSERKAAAETLRDAQEEFRLLVDGVTDYAIYLLDPAGNVATWNVGAQRIKGYAAHEIIGRHFSRFYTEEERAAGVPQLALETALREGRFEREGWRVRKDGQRFWANVVIDAIRNPDGSIRGYAKITRDITERRRAQQEAERTREMLMQAQKMDAIGQLTGGVAHDFNNLLTAIISSVELMRRRVGEDPRLAGLLDNTMQAAQRGATLTQRMLAFARRQSLKPVPTDISELITGMTELLDRSLGPSFTIVTKLPLRLPPVLVDRNQLEMAVLNLVVNARDATAGGGAITIAARQTELAPGNTYGMADGAYVVISIIDHGEGMDEATLERAVEPFFTTKGAGKGTGLGLSMVHGLAEQSHGRFVLESERGEGTTANLWLPVGRRGGEAEAPELVPVPAADTSPLAILVVDDDALVAMNTAAMLEDLGHRVVTAFSGKQAFDILTKGQAFDLLITDQGMPGMTGSELIGKVRAARPGLRMLLATGYAELPAGTAEDVPRLAKPFLQPQLAAAVAQAIR